MSVLDRFRRNRQQSVLPNEVQEYYQSEQRQRRGLALILGIVALLVTIAIAAALFFGGRFLYNKFRGDETKPTSTTSQNSDQSNEPNPADEQAGTDSSGTTTPTTPQPSTPAPSSNPAPSPAPAPATSPSATPALGDTQALPHTGDEGM